MLKSWQAISFHLFSDENKKYAGNGKNKDHLIFIYNGVCTQIFPASIFAPIIYYFCLLFTGVSL